MAHEFYLNNIENLFDFDRFSKKKFERLVNNSNFSIANFMFFLFVIGNQINFSNFSERRFYNEFNN